ncbi:hypothetical protein [Stratiformator vulcanicus]|uniref:Uncharacterized protein n=1 Tax=Stratiformator vulcanicus TaxID=2527980 RepID=A0A517R7C1_9PLAN|nr:hypothetical protein [Stratiformator vulcanicus]QDT39721.1 hypothetical protein Pan189_41300 [Stratiformator vulcanicus]
MNEPFPVLQPGDRIDLRASTWNAMIRAGRRTRSASGPAAASKGRGVNGVWLLVENDTGRDVEQFDACLVAGSILGPADGGFEQDSPTGLLTLDTGDPFATPAIALESIPNGETGRVLMIGASLVRVEVTDDDDDHAAVTDVASAATTGDHLARHFKTGTTGPLKLWWVEPDPGSGQSTAGVDLRWALALIGGSDGGGVRLGRCTSEGGSASASTGSGDLRVWELQPVSVLFNDAAGVQVSSTVDLSGDRIFAAAPEDITYSDDLLVSFAPGTGGDLFVLNSYGIAVVPSVSGSASGSGSPSGTGSLSGSGTASASGSQGSGTGGSGSGGSGSGSGSISGSGPSVSASGSNSQGSVSASDGSGSLGSGSSSSASSGSSSSAIVIPKVTACGCDDVPQYWDIDSIDIIRTTTWDCTPGDTATYTKYHRLGHSSGCEWTDNDIHGGTENFAAPADDCRFGSLRLWDTPWGWLRLDISTSRNTWIALYRALYADEAEKCALLTGGDLVLTKQSDGYWHYTWPATITLTPSAGP